MGAYFGSGGTSHQGVHAAYARDSQRIDRLAQSARYACSNLECGHTFLLRTEILYVLSPSATPDESIKLPTKAERDEQRQKPRHSAARTCRQPEQLQLPEL